ncbi:hypothetical protein COO20_04270 [Thalassospira marina]|uniref:Uncharacterized protein n=2 Tax=Thalassospira marina TaxID=2048283 RepID=A0A2N3KXV4_9PROT|nr:hypothetical protein COO20_04270 [Thalassospira marina]
MHVIRERTMRKQIKSEPVVAESALNELKKILDDLRRDPSLYSVAVYLAAAISDLESRRG